MLYRATIVLFAVAANVRAAPIPKASAGVKLAADDELPDWDGSNEELKTAIDKEPQGGISSCMSTCKLANPPTCASAKAMAGTCAAKCEPWQKDDLLVMAKDQPCLWYYLPPSPPPTPVSVAAPLEPYVPVTKVSHDPRAQTAPAITGGANEKDPSHPSVKTGKTLGPAEPHVIGGGVCGTATCGPKGNEPCLDCGDVSSDNGMPKDPPSVDTPNDGLPALDKKPMHHTLKLDFMDDWNGSNKQLKHAIKYEPSGGFATCMATCPLENPPTCAAAKQMAGTCAVKCNPAQKDDLLVMATDQPCLFNYLPPSPPPVPFSQNPAQHTPAITGGANEKDPSHPSVKTGKVLGPAEPHVVGGGVCGTSTCGPSGTEPCLDCGDVSSDDGMPKDPPSIDTPNDGLPPLDTNPQHRKL